MAATESIVQKRQDHVLQASIRNRRHLVVTHNGPLGWRTLKSAFVSGSRHSGELAVRVMLSDEADSLHLPQRGDTLGGTFRDGHKKCMFRSELLSHRVLAGEATLVLKWPAHLQQLRRRAYERVAPPRDQVVAVRFWREVDGSDREGGTRTLKHGQLEDISCGGLRMRVANAGDLVMGATYKCVFAPRPGKPSLLLEGILRHREAVEQGRASLGFQFVGMETTQEGMRTLDRLARIVSHFQRSKGRRSPQRGSQT